LRWVVVGLVGIAALTPLGLLAPGGAFGEDPPADLNLQRYHLSAVPNGLARYAGIWHHAIFDGYDFRHDSNPTVGYLVSALVGVAVILVAVLVALALVRRVGRVRSRRRAVESAVA
jgi:cobalt/nickel transport system permease protein